METHVHFHCNGFELHADGLPLTEEAGKTLPPGLEAGLYSIFYLLESRLAGLESISVAGVWFMEDRPEFCAMDIWAQTSEEGFYLPMASAAALFSEMGIPYYHRAPR